MAASLDYIDVPASASRLRQQNSPNRDVNQIRRASRILTALPHPPPPPLHRRSDSASSITSPTKNAVNLLPQLLLSSLPSSTPSSSTNNNNPRATQQPTSSKLLSSRDPLSVPILTVNFKRFVERVGPIFWLQDRIEEIVFWKRGWRATTVWIAGYAFFCYFPRLLLLIPQIALIGIMLGTHPDANTNGTVKHRQNSKSLDGQEAVAAPVDWQANIQGIQNLMGFVADADAFLQPYLPYLTHRSPYSPHLLTLLFVSLLPAIVVVSLPFFPLRTVALFIGIGPLLCTNPWVSPHLPHLLAIVHANLENTALVRKIRARIDIKGRSASLRTLAVRAVDDANLTDECWVAQRREVELFENERFGTAAGDALQQEWSKSNLRDGERSGWTRGRDGWSGVGQAVSSNLTFSLDPGWAFVTTEDWRADVEARWAGIDGADEPADEDGWVYTNDAWTELRPPSASYAPGIGGLTRRRRWVRRIWYDHARAS
ncbi:integral peroxisomal membrane peroxin-domain-containing protein [Mycena amicta]|nr:integral peroxisomal membrane peroxin-domain-containing protein [Mycena amicta]